MSRKTVLCLSVVAAVLIFAAFGSALVTRDSKEKTIEVAMVAGHDTDPRDHGRPVILVASALGVPTQVFRDAFTHVHPAPAGQEPDPEQVRRNKDTLLATLSKYGVTNDRLDEVSNYYRYNGSQGELWRNRSAKISVTLENGVFKRATIEDEGAGYTTAPSLSVPGYPSVKLAAKVAFGTDLAKNGAIAKVELAKD
jgi:hypothetical protein